ncbi:proprotein convertase P-domain-containing protein [Kribbella sp. CA-293567]|uniref:proprotein convertase P-domain-containing protein n=1 Tax=Kribbella sp. CA-293567 TaxID=3002436 RepID=UPI0022DE89D6|nr:proprotein convertase P-domain-containing protein [Kribbella sp. CA-293567]WBQ04066.1 proprotein convertase P-domain-containing protein [Kribbella sp. CA-293567]
MKRRRKTAATVGGAAVLASIAALVAVGGPANAEQSRASGSGPEALLQQQAVLHQVSGKLAPSPAQAGRWIADGKLMVAVTTQQEAAKVQQAGATPKLVNRSQAQLDALFVKVDKIATADRGKGLQSWGIDPVSNKVVVKVRGAYGGLRGLGDGVQVVQVSTTYKQQAGEVHPGDPWWPGSETYCSVGFPATDAQGNKHFVTAGHCTNDANQAAYGAIGQANRLGTSNVGGSRSINAREGDMGVVAVTESGWTLSPNVNTWGSPAVTVSGTADAIVGDAVCHSGNTAPKWECGTVTAVNQSINYGNVTIDGLSTTNACSQGGDSGGAWLRGSEAVGLHSGGNSSCVSGDSGNSIFQPVREALTKWNLTLLTGAPDPGGDDEAPTTPGNVRSTGTTSDSVSLAWDASTDNTAVTGYEVYNGSALATSVTGTTATVSGLTADTSYSFTIRAKDAAGNKSQASSAVTARTQPGGPGGGRTFANGTDFPIRDFQTVVSPIRSTATGKTASQLKVTVEGNHTCLEDLNISLVSPSGRWYYLQRTGGAICHPLPASKTYTLTPTGTENAAGTWNLRIGDNGPGDTGALTNWSITL